MKRFYDVITDCTVVLQIGDKCEVTHLTFPEVPCSTRALPFFIFNFYIHLYSKHHGLYEHLMELSKSYCYLVYFLGFLNIKLLCNSMSNNHKRCLKLLNYIMNCDGI